MSSDPPEENSSKPDSTLNVGSKNPGPPDESSLPDLSTHYGSGNSGPAPHPHTSGETEVEHFLIEERIGEGGMGTVFRAQQTHPIKRRVALKVIKASRHSSQQIIARFEAERQAVALMEHPNIAKVFDAGTTRDGSPYFAMEFVDGEPLSGFCDGEKLSVEDRLKLFVPVCQAIQHAHQKGIIHRDLKPSNVLVGSVDGEPVPKVIDFGLAKATEQMQLTDKSMHTEYGQVLGTPQYMSPEQAAIDHLNVDTRTDVFSLGVMLYELLTGTTPLQQEKLGRKALLKVLEMVRDQEPVRPSTRLNDSTDTIEEISDKRKIEPVRLKQILKGELDWIVMKAIEREPDRRYQTSNELAEDVKRFLNDEPVQARPPSRTYLLQKFVKKNRGLVASLATIFVLLASALAIIGWLAISANRSATLAIAEQKNAQASSDRYEGILGIVAESFESMNPIFYGTTIDMSAKDVLDKATESLNESELDEYGQMEFCQTLAICFTGIGEYEDALRYAKEELRLREKLLPNDPSVVEALMALGTVYRKRGSSAESLDFSQQAFDRLSEFPDASAEVSLTAAFNLVSSLTVSGEYSEAVELGRKTLAEAQSFDGPNGLYTLNSLSALGAALNKSGLKQEAADVLESLVEKQTELLGADDLRTMQNSMTLADARRRLGDVEGVVELLEKNLVQFEKRLGKNHSYYILNLGQLGQAYREVKRYEKSFETFENALSLFQGESLGNHPGALTLKGNYAFALREGGKIEESADIFEEVVEDSREHLGETHPETLIAMSNLAASYFFLNRHNDTIKLLGPGNELIEKNAHVDEIRDGTTRFLGVAYTNVGRFKQAAPLLLKTRDRYEKQYGRHSLETQGVHIKLAECYSGLGNLNEAIPLYEEVVAYAKTNPKFPQGHEVSLRQPYLRTKQYDKLKSMLDEELKKGRTAMKPDSDGLIQMVVEFGNYFLEMEDFKRAESLFREGMEASERRGMNHIGIDNLKISLAWAMKELGNIRGADALVTEGYESLLKRKNELPAAVRSRFLGVAKQRFDAIKELADKSED